MSYQNDDTFEYDSKLNGSELALMMKLECSEINENDDFIQKQMAELNEKTSTHR